MTNHNGNNPGVVNAHNKMGTNSFIHFNPLSQLALKLSCGQNFATWKDQFSMLMYVDILFVYIDGTTLDPVA